MVRCAHVKPNLNRPKILNNLFIFECVEESNETQRKLRAVVVIRSAKTFQSVFIKAGNTNFLHKYTKVRH